MKKQILIKIGEHTETRSKMVSNGFDENGDEIFTEQTETVVIPDYAPAEVDCDDEIAPDETTDQTAPSEPNTALNEMVADMSTATTLAQMRAAAKAFITKTEGAAE